MASTHPFHPVSFEYSPRKNKNLVYKHYGNVKPNKFLHQWKKLLFESTYL